MAYEDAKETLAWVVVTDTRKGDTHGDQYFYEVKDTRIRISTVLSDILKQNDLLVRSTCSLRVMMVFGSVVDVRQDGYSVRGEKGLRLSQASADPDGDAPKRRLLMSAEDPPTLQIDMVDGDSSRGPPEAPPRYKMPFGRSSSKKQGPPSPSPPSHSFIYWTN